MNNTFWCVVAISEEDNSEVMLLEYARNSIFKCRNAVRDYAWKTEQFTGTTELRLKQLNWEIREFHIDLLPKTWIKLPEGTDPSDMVTIRWMFDENDSIGRIKEAIEKEFDTFCTFKFEVLPHIASDGRFIRFTIDVDAHSYSQIQDQIESWIDGYVAATDGLVSTIGFN